MKTTRRAALIGLAALSASAVLVPSWARMRRGGLVSAGGGPPAATLFISPTGSDSNTGSLSSPWAITSLETSSANFTKIEGHAVGIIGDEGTYNVGSMMVNDPVSGALQVPGGSSSSWTYLESVNSAGTYAPGEATITAFYNGLYGGHHSTGAGNWDGPILSHSGEYPASYPLGYLGIYGIVFTGYSYKGVRIGGASSGDGPVITAPVWIVDCTFTGEGFNAGDFQDNGTSLWVDPFQPSGTAFTGNGFVAKNDYFHDNAWYSTPTDADHLAAIQTWAGSTLSTEHYGDELEFNTVINSGDIYGKEGNIDGSSIHNNFVDASMYTSAGSTAYPDFMAGGSGPDGLTHPSFFYNNIGIVYGNVPTANNLMAFPTLGQNSHGSVWGWQTAVSFTKNTLVSVGSSGTPVVIMANAADEDSGLGQLVARDDLYTASSTSGSWNSFGNFLTTAKSVLQWDYMGYPSSGVSWNIVPEAANGAMCASSTAYTSPSAFAAAVLAGGGVSGVDAHSIRGTPTFTGTGTSSQKYQLAPGSFGKNAASDGTDLGAWGGGTTQIGSTLAP